MNAAPKPKGAMQIIARLKCVVEKESGRKAFRVLVGKGEARLIAWELHSGTVESLVGVEVPTEEEIVEGISDGLMELSGLPVRLMPHDGYAIETVTEIMADKLFPK